MTAMNFGRNCLSVLSCKAFAALIGMMATAQIFGVNLSHECLDRQEVYGKTTTIYHGAAVEPSIAVNPKKRKQIVAAWQQDRISNAAALEIGISYTRDGGKRWCKSKVPFQICAGGITQRVGDSWLSYAADGSKVYLCVAVLNATQEPNTDNQAGVVVSVSEDGGKNWSTPRYLFSSMEYLSDPTKQFANPDKTSITADPNDRRRAIAVWANFNPSTSYHGDAQGSYTVDGGKTWSAVQQIYDPFPDLVREGLSNGIQNDNQASNNVVVILPRKKYLRKPRLSGDWLNFTVRVYARPGTTDAQYTSDTFPFQYTLTDIAVVRSKDRGKTWDPEATVIVPSFVNNLIFTGGYTYDQDGAITGGIGSLMRDDQTLPSYNVNPKNGFLYVAYQSSEFRSDQLQQIGLSTSRDGGRSWSAGAQVSRTPAQCPNPQAFEPFVAVTRNGRVGVLYFDFRNDDRSDLSKTQMDAWLAIYQEVEDPQGGSTKIGLDFVKEIRLSEESYIAQNGPLTTQGYMTDGDYQFMTTHGNDFYAIYTKSFNGPFAPATVFFTDPIHQAIILLDNNYRTAPFVSIIKNTRNGANLISTKKLK
jgi:hypothetical protein